MQQLRTMSVIGAFDLLMIFAACSRICIKEFNFTCSTQKKRLLYNTWQGLIGYTIWFGMRLLYNIQDKCFTIN